ncbi:Hydrogenase maturation factor HypD [bioreactor metagenome]|uniref:Hydrogenase maturation factor HypD n=1 Tax=bioreactor metagenome TaxID=1076179 RepID=A0A644TLR1_9ZZZZ|nr:hydrogenase formation protein HypD [Negativicutes bacterium]
MQSITVSEVKKAADFFVSEIKNLNVRPLRLMEVCGTHTVAIFKAGIRQMLPVEIELVSGPGCPVCVTPNEYLDTAIAYSRQSDVIITTFGDMLRVPGTETTLLDARAQGGDIRIVYSPLDSLEIAKANPAKKVIFLAVGFETTAPTAAATILTAKQQNLSNFFVLSAHKLVPPALEALLAMPHVKVDGFLLPGHVSAIIGLAPYEILGTQHNIPTVVAGFEPLDILRSVYMLVKQVIEGRAEIENQYSRIVPIDGNKAARQVLEQVYQPCDAVWRGLGKIPGSGLELKSGYNEFDALAHLPVKVGHSQEPRGCRCGEVLSGIVKPTACPLFGTACQPEHPVGACMVSVEGSCAAWYKYGAGRWQM